MSQKITNFVDDYRSAVEQLAAAVEALDGLRLEWDALSYATVIEQEHLTGLNEDITPAQLADGFSSHAAINTLLNTGHRTNLYRLLR